MLTLLFTFALFTAGGGRTPAATRRRQGLAPDAGFHPDGSNRSPNGEDSRPRANAVGKGVPAAALGRDPPKGIPVFYASFLSDG